jgi:hypothetical protein
MFCCWQSSDKVSVLGASAIKAEETAAKANDDLRRHCWRSGPGIGGLYTVASNYDYAFVGPSNCVMPLGDTSVKAGERVGHECEELQITQQRSEKIDVLDLSKEYGPDGDPRNNQHYDLSFF